MNATQPAKMANGKPVEELVLPAELPAAASAAAIHKGLDP